MMMVRKGLLLVAVATLFAMKTSMIVCMEEQKQEIKEIAAFVASWKDRKEVIKEYMQRAEESQKNVDYIEEGKVVATFSCPDTIFLDPESSNQSLACSLFLSLIDEMNKNGQTDEASPLVKKDEATKGIFPNCHLY